jgi:hypothetical protein
LFYFFVQQASYGEDVTITDEFDPEVASQTGSAASERGIDIGRVGSWATDFEKLLADPVGLRTFAVRSVFIFHCLASKCR